MGDHLARALREEEINRLPQHRIAIEKEDILFFEDHRQKRAKEEERKFEERKNTQGVFLPFHDILNKWQKSEMEKELEGLQKEHRANKKAAVERAKQERIK